jgi:hypothetical protein
MIPRSLAVNTLLVLGRQAWYKKDQILCLVAIWRESTSQRERTCASDCQPLWLSFKSLHVFMDLVYDIRGN